MDPKKQNDYFKNNEYESKVYRISRGMESVRTHAPYIADNRVQLPPSKKICDCSTHTNDKLCSECQPSGRHLVENHRWSTDPMQRAYISINTQNVIKQNTNSIYVQQANSSRSFWSHGKTSTLEEPIVKCKQPYVLQQAQHLSPPSSTIDVSEQRCYKDGAYTFAAHPFPPKEELVTSPKIKYSIASAAKSQSTTICSVDMRNKPLETIHNKTEHVVNPVNDLALKEPDLSPNYARKCPQIFAVNEHNETFLNLYMTTPHFSSDKFSSPSHNEPKIPKRDLRQSGMRLQSSYNNYSAQTKIAAEENSAPSAIGYNNISQTQYQQQQQNDFKKSHHTAHQPLQHAYFPGSISTHTNNYYESIPAKMIAADYTSAQSVPTHPSTSDLYQYSKTPITLAQPVQVTLAPSCGEVSYVKKEDIQYDEQEYSKQNNSYLNSYNAPPASETTIKKESSPFTTTPEPALQDYRFAYDSLKMNHSPVALQTLSANIKPSQESHCYYAHPPSSKVSPQPPLLTSPHTAELSIKIQQQQRLHSQQQQQNNLIQKYPESTRLQYNTNKNQHVMVKSLDEAAMEQNHAVICYTNDIQTPLPTQSSPFTVQQLSQTTPSFTSKKSQVPKPNYRELINQVYAMRNATSEQELNMKIIKKTLNVDPSFHAIRTPEINSKHTLSMSTIDKHSIQESNIGSNDIMDVKPLPNQIIGLGQQHLQSQQSPSPLLPRIECVKKNDTSSSRIFKLEEKASSHNSPLDLSMRTVKTIADSTEYKYQPLAVSNKKNNNYKSVSVNALPRVDFQPNFALHTEHHNTSNGGSNKSSVHMLLEKQTDHGYPQINNIPSPTFNIIEPSQMPRQSSFGENSYETTPKPHSIGSSVITKRSEQHLNSSFSINHNGINALESCTIDTKIRPSVVEATPLPVIVKSESRELIKIPPVEELPTEVRIIAISKSCQAPIKAIITPTPICAEQKPSPPLSGQPPQGGYVTEFLRNPRFLGKKRHLHEYSNSKYMEQVTAKQTRFINETIDMPSAEPYTTNMNPNMIANNNQTSSDVDQVHTAEKSIQAEIPYDLDVSKVDAVPLAPVTNETNAGTNCFKTETNLLIASRIRTKAELKGFTFQASPSVVIETPVLDTVKIKEENICNEKNTLMDLNEEFNEKCLLDFSWRRTCNSFVEQLLTTNSANIQPISTQIVVETLNESIQQQQPIAKIAIPFHEKCLSTKADNFRVVEADIEQNYQNAVQVKTVIQKKNIRIDREKLRLQQEKRLAARLQGGSSSETDNELDKRKSERLKKPNIKPKTRPTITSCYVGKNHFSDCGSDSSSSEAELNILTLRKHKKVSEQKSSKSPIEQSNKKCKSKIYEVDSNNSDEYRKHQQKLNISCVKNADSDSEKPKTVTEKQSDIGNNKMQHTSPTVATKAITKVNNKSSNNSNTNDNKNKTSQIYAKAALNTMTRSKRKRELELQLANSKVLRNDKIIRNSTAKIKRKYVRKFTVNQNSNNKESLSGESNSQIIVTRLRSMRDKVTGTAASLALRAPPKNRKSDRQCENKMKSNTCKNSSKKRDGQTDSILEFYRYKRALKIPPSLITIRRLANHKIAESLPDLESKPCDFELSDFRKQRGKSLHADCAPLTTALAKMSEEPKSIIDVLHSRVVNSVNSTTTSHAKSNLTTAIKSATSKLINNRFATTEINAPNELLSILKQSDVCKEEDDDVNMATKKKHFSIFETKVLQTKTRTESKLQQRREIIREIFVGNDRPASAPPEMTQQLSDGHIVGGINSSGEAMTYEQKFEQFLRQMNAENIQNFGRPLHLRTITNSAVVTTMPENSIKLEEDTESASAIDTEDKSIDCNESTIGNMEIKSIMPNSLLKRRRPTKYLRRKGSSGFDYLRKKKRNSNTNGTACSSNTCTVGSKSERGDDEYKYKVKTESDVCREIQKWVLNKGVGQSTMHKAARLGYIDVIVYCLDRMGLNPDQKDNAGYTPLHEACTNGWLDIARLLLMYGANHSEAALSGIRPLHEASDNDHEEIVRLLLSYGADPLLATYSDQTPLMMATSPLMRDLLNNHLSDVQSIGSNRKPWRFNGPWEIIESSACGFNIFNDAPGLTCDMSSALRKRSVSSMITRKNLFKRCEENKPNNEAAKEERILKKTVNDKESIDIKMNTVHTLSDNEPVEYLFNNSDNDGEIFEFEEADVLLPPLYLLKDEGTDKWVLLSDLCNLLKVKSKDTLLNKIFPSSSMSVAHKSLMRELKMSDFLEKATCLQLLCAGEKFNICASKVVLIKYNESVKNLLGVKTILMKF